MFRCEDCGCEFSVRNRDEEEMYRCPRCLSFNANPDIVYDDDDD